MATACPTGFDAKRLRESVRTIYDRVAADPATGFHFNVGLEYAVNLLHYDRRDLETLPKRATARFAGVGNPHRIGPIPPGATVVDIGSGAGADLLIAALRVGPSGRAIGVDPNLAMRESVMASARDAGLADRVSTLDGISESLPLPDGSADVAISNGVLNLAMDKRKAVAEIHRVLRPGGKLYLADVFLDVQLRESERANSDLWAGCVAGALREEELIEIARQEGFKDCRIVERFRSFQGSQVEKKVSAKAGVHGANFSGVS
ncbi:MAG TPA: methyltransferase domain-containing protein [Terriglobia bacterium]|nr:methyltransferase domain-containing protein [Terriglobia bacterium]